jgi:hypothetical protein
MKICKHCKQAIEPTRAGWIHSAALFFTCGSSINANFAEPITVKDYYNAL